MDVVFAFDVSGLILMFPIFDLDGGMVDSMLAADFRGFLEDFIEIAVREDMSTHCWFANAERPDVQVVNFRDLIDFKELFSEILDFDILWSAFHKHANAVLHDSYSGEHDEDWE